MQSGWGGGERGREKISKEYGLPAGFDLGLRYWDFKGKGREGQGT